MSDHFQPLHPEKPQCELSMNKKKIFSVPQHPTQQYLVEELNTGVVIIHVQSAATKMKTHIGTDLTV
jgi:hypothetical protein